MVTLSCYISTCRKAKNFRDNYRNSQNKDITNQKTSSATDSKMIRQYVYCFAVLLTSCFAAGLCWYFANSWYYQNKAGTQQ